MYKRQDWDADEVDEVQAFDADGGDEVMAFDDTTPASPRDTAAPTTSAESPPPAPELGAQRTAAVITEFAAQAKGARRAQQARAFARHALTHGCASGDLTLRVGDVVVLTKAPADKQWWKGHIEGDRSRKGVFPKMFVKEIGAASPFSPPAATAPRPLPFSPPAPAEAAAAAAPAPAPAAR